MNRLLSFVGVAAVVLLVQNCRDISTTTGSQASGLTPDPIFTPVTLPVEFNGYWYEGKAELCAYDVEQERYGAIRQAEQVNVFVTEDFSKSRQVKLDNPGAAGADKIPVLKLNSIRRFDTGIYDYSLMQSVFTPVSGMSTLKITTSVQDWCGHVFMQLNLAENAYRARVFSYFEQEADQDVSLPMVLMEDEIWTRIRLNPAAIPTGKIKMLPSALYSRLRHKPLTAQDADIQMVKGADTSTVSIKYTSIGRTLQIRFGSAFPYRILGWEETNDGQLASKGTLKSIRRSAYWTEHDLVHTPLRDSLHILRRH